MIILKKAISLVLVLLVVFAVGCGADNNQVPTQPTQTEQSQTQQPAQPQQPTQTQQPSNTPDTSGFIGEEKAKEIALERAGLTADAVIFDRVELDRDDGVWQYEIDFRQDRTEYDVDIKADDGTIISFETDFDD